MPGGPDGEQPPDDELGEEPEAEPWDLSSEQVAHLRQSFPHFRVTPLTTPSDAEFAEWLEQGLRQ